MTFSYKNSTWLRGQGQKRRSWSFNAATAAEPPQRLEVHDTGRAQWEVFATYLARSSGILLGVIAATCPQVSLHYRDTHFGQNGQTSKALLIEISYHVREQLWRKRCALCIKESCHLIVPELLSQSSQKPRAAEPSLILAFFLEALLHSRSSATVKIQNLPRLMGY